MHDDPSPNSDRPTKGDIEAYRMTYSLMIGLSAQRFMAISFLFAASGFLASSAASERLQLLPTAGLVIVLTGLTVAGRLIVGSLTEGTLHLIRRCQEIEIAANISEGFGIRFNEQDRLHHKGTGSNAARLSARLLGWIVALYSVVILLSKAYDASPENGPWVWWVAASVGILAAIAALWDERPRLLRPKN